MTIAFAPFTGNCPRNVNKDAKYALRTGPRGPVVALTYNSPNGERWLATTEDHPELVKMVNSVKLNMSDAPNGPFYINEYGQVIVPVRDGQTTTYYFADDYDLPLRFDFEGTILSGDAVNEDGEDLESGDLWTGPHAGIPYVLKAGDLDIYYTTQPRPNVETKVLLSEHVGKEWASVVARKVRAVKGPAGGRFYINECGEMFAPVDGANGWEYLYIEHLDLDVDAWFDKPL